jgi:hypothetical protein
MDVSRCVGRYEGDLKKDNFHGRGNFTSAQGGWRYCGALDRDQPTEGELVEADGRRFKVTYSKHCASIKENPKPKTKVRVVCGAGAQELPEVHTRPCQSAGICCAGHCKGTLAVDMLRSVCVGGD